MDPNYSNIPPNPNLIPPTDYSNQPNKTDFSKKKIGAVFLIVLVLASLVFYYFAVPRKGMEEVSIPASELILTGVIVEKKPDSISIISPNPPIPNQKPELYIMKVLPETGFTKIDGTSLNSTEEKITLDDLKISQGVFVRYTRDKLGNFSARNIYMIISPPVSTSNTEKLKK